jgi:hypothetical protein
MILQLLQQTTEERGPNRNIYNTSLHLIWKHAIKTKYTALCIPDWDAVLEFEDTSGTQYCPRAHEICFG